LIFWEPLVKCAPCIADSFLLKCYVHVLFPMLFVNHFYASVVVQSTALLQSLLHPLWSPLLACLLPSFLIHTLGCFLFLPPFMSEWSVKSFHYVCMVTMAPTLMRSSPRVFHYVTLISMPPAHTIVSSHGLFWVHVFFFFSPRRWEGTKENGLNCHQIQSFNKVLF
jgi:hypothetical protein